MLMPRGNRINAMEISDCESVYDVLASNATTDEETKISGLKERKTLKFFRIPGH